MKKFAAIFLALCSCESQDQGARMAALEQRVEALEQRQLVPEKTRVLNGQVYVKIDGRWYRKTR